MKIIFASFILVVFALAFAACGKIETFTNLTQQKIETEKTADEQPDEPPILEIVQDAEGMQSVTGKTLFFNLYDNGVIEFEYEDDQKRSAGVSSKGKENETLKAEEINALKRAKISKEELQKFIDLLKSEAFQNAKSDYQQKCCLSDATIDYKISFTDSLKQKNINVSFTDGFRQKCKVCEPDGSQKRNNIDFPAVLTELLILADNLRTKYNSEKSSNQPE